MELDSVTNQLSIANYQLSIIKNDIRRETKRDN